MVIFGVAIHMAAWGPVAAQEARAQRLTFEQALRLAESTSEELAIAGAGLMRASGEQKRARSEYLPRVDLTASYVRTLASEFEGLTFDGPELNGEPNVDLDQLPFGRLHAYSIGLSVGQTIVAAGRAAQTQIADAGRATEEIAFLSARAQVALDVTLAYFDAVLSDRLYAIAQATLEQAESTARLVRVGHEVGDQAEFEVLRAQVTFENQRPVTIQRAAERSIAYTRLKQLLDLPLDEPLELAEELAGEEPVPAPEIVTAALGIELDTALTRAAVRQAFEAVRAQEALVDIARGQRIPSIAVDMQYARVGYPRSGLPVWNEFRTNWSIAGTVSVPLFTGGRITGDVEVARADRDAAVARLGLTRELAALDTRDAIERLKAAEAAHQATTGTIDQAARAYAIAEVRFQEGISTQLELNDSRIALEQAEANRAVAERDLHVAHVRVALLPYLPIPSAPGAEMGVPAATGVTEPELPPVMPRGVTPAAAGSPFGTTAAARGPGL